MSDNFNPTPSEPEDAKPVEEYPAAPSAEGTAQQPDYTQGQADYSQQPQYDQSAYAQPQEGQDYSQAPAQYDPSQYAQPQYDQSQYAQPQYDQSQYAQPQYDQSQYAQPQYDPTQYAQPNYGQPQYDQAQYAQPQYDPTQYAQPDYGQPQYDQAQYGQAGGGYAVPAGTPQKSRMVAGLLGLLLPFFAAHNFYLGFMGKAILQLVLNFVTFGMTSLWPFIEGIFYLVSKDNPKWSVDANNVPLRD